MEKATNEDIANYTNKKTTTINQWKRIAPGLLELCRIGAFCKKNGINIDMIKNCIELKEMAKKDNV
jgi:hypothetical protein